MNFYEVDSYSDPGDSRNDKTPDTDPLQGGLFNPQPATARSSDPETSHAAAASIDAPTMRKNLAAVLECHRQYPNGLTDESMLWCYREKPKRGWPEQSDSGLRTRRRELADMGHIADSGERSQTVSGRNSIVWKVAD